jgi:hypothetical protein
MFFTAVTTLLGVSSEVEERGKGCTVEIEVVNRANKTVHAEIDVIVNSESGGLNVSSGGRGFKSFCLYKAICFNVAEFAAVLVTALRSVGLANVLAGANRVSVALVVFADNARGRIVSFSSVATSARSFLRGVFVSPVLVSSVLVGLVADRFFLA